MRNWLSRTWYRLVTRRALRRKVLNAGMAVVEVNHMMVRARVPRRMRRQFFRELWRRPVSALEILERALYGRVGKLEQR